MPDKKKLILDTFEKVLPDLTENETDMLLAFGEGVSLFKTREKEQAARLDRTADSACHSN